MKEKAFEIVDTDNVRLLRRNPRGFGALLDKLIQAGAGKSLVVAPVTTFESARSTFYASARARGVRVRVYMTADGKLAVSLREKK